MVDLSQYSTEELLRMRNGSQASNADFLTQLVPDKNTGNDLSQYSTEQLLAMRSNAAQAAQRSTDDLRQGYRSIVNTVAPPINSAMAALSSLIPQSVKDTAGNLIQKEFPVASQIAPMAIQAGKQELNDLGSYDANLKPDLAALSQNAQLAGNLAIAKPLLEGVGNYGRAVAAERAAIPLPPVPLEMRALQKNLVEGQKGVGMFPRKQNAPLTGMDANRAITRQYGVEKELQSQLYSKVDEFGSQFSSIGEKANNVYTQLDDAINSLKGKVAQGSDEHLALSHLEEIRDNISARNGIASTPDKQMQLPSWKRPMVVEKGVPGQAAYGVQPSDLIDIKSAINSISNPNKFTTSGKGTLLSFKNDVTEALAEAGRLHPEFGKALTAAEQQAAKVGKFKSSEIRTLWQPEDYVAYKAAMPTLDADGNIIKQAFGSGATPGTVNRANKFLSTLSGINTAGKTQALTDILPPEIVQDIFRSAMKQERAGATQIPLRPRGALSAAISAIIEPRRLPLNQLAKDLRRGK